MGVNTGEIQPITADTWIVPDLNRTRDIQAVPPVAKSEGGTTQQLSDNKSGSAENSQSQLSGQDGGQTEQLANEVQAYLDEATKFELNFKVNDGTGKTVVQVLDKTTGQVIRQIPPEHLLQARNKLEELRGVLFDGQV